MASFSLEDDDGASLFITQSDIVLNGDNNGNDGNYDQLLDTNDGHAVTPHYSDIWDYEGDFQCSQNYTSQPSTIQR